MCLIRLRTAKLIFFILGFLICLNGYCQLDSCKVIKVTSKKYDDISQISESYTPEGIYLLQNGVYNLKIKGRAYTNYRILKIWNDSLQIAWTLDSLPSFSFGINEIQKVIYPSLNDGVVGFPHPNMNAKKHQFQMYCRVPYRLKPIEVCLDDDCGKKTYGYPFVVSGYKWKPIIRIDGQILMIDNQVTHTLNRN